MHGCCAPLPPGSSCVLASLLVPQPPSFCSTPAEDEAKAAERRARIQQEVQADEERLAEQRWPFTGPRTAAKTTSLHAHPLKWRSPDSIASSSLTAARRSESGGVEGPSDGGAGSPMLQRLPRPISATRPVVKETAAALLRAQATKQAMMDGKFDTREER